MRQQRVWVHHAGAYDAAHAVPRPRSRYPLALAENQGGHHPRLRAGLESTLCGGAHGLFSLQEGQPGRVFQDRHSAVDL
jgi:hypothetical protein